VLLAQLLAARRLDALGNLVEWRVAEANRAWSMLQAKYPTNFVVGPSLLQRWREGVVASSEQAARWSSAVFHLDRLVQDHPEDRTLRLRRARARNGVAAEELR